jgi:hypothetical protein
MKRKPDFLFPVGEHAQKNTISLNASAVITDRASFKDYTWPDPYDFDYPWHKKIVDVIHDSGKPAILHSCGNLAEVMEDIIEDLHYDGKHSYEVEISLL